MLGQRMSRKRDDLNGHERPQRQACQRLVERGRVRCCPDATIREPAGHAPDRPQYPGLGQGGSASEFGFEVLVAKLIAEIVGKSNLDLDEELHGRDDTGPGCRRFGRRQRRV